MIGYLLILCVIWLLGGWIMDMYENDVFGDDDDE